MKDYGYSGLMLGVYILLGLTIGWNWTFYVAVISAVVLLLWARKQEKKRFSPLGRNA